MFVSFLLVTVLINFKCRAIEICGLEELPYCDPNDTSCMLENVEPKARKWLIKGQKEYFVEPIESYVIEAQPLTVNDKAYKLEKVKFNGFENLKLTDWKLDTQKMLLTYDYDLKLDIAIDKITDEKEESVTGNKNVILHLNNTHTTTVVSIEIIKRCDGSKYFTFTNPSITVRDITADQVSANVDLEEEILKGLAKTLTYNANRIISKGWRQFAASVPVKNYWKLDL